MKFGNLTSAQRSALSVLCNVGVTRTNKLAKSMGLDAQCAAYSLCHMRKQGLVFSHQKSGNDVYANWDVSEYGRAVFDNRPHEVELSKPPVQPSNVRYAVVKAIPHSVTGTMTEAVQTAEQYAMSQGDDYHVIALAALVEAPKQPQPTVTLL